MVDESRRKFLIAGAAAAGALAAGIGISAVPPPSGAYDFWRDAPVGVRVDYEGDLGAHANLPNGGSPKWITLGVDMLALGADPALGNHGTEGGTESLGAESLHGATPAGGGHTHASQGAHQHDVHAGTAVSNHSDHAVTQPSGHSNHIVTQPSAHSNHVVTQPSAHSNHVVTQPATHTTHQHELPYYKVAGGTGAFRMIPQSVFGSGTSRAAESTDASSANTTAGAVALSQGVAPNAHSGTAVDAHSSHSGTAVDAHSAHSGTAVDAHSVHSGTAIDAHSVHSVTQPNQHGSDGGHTHDVVADHMHGGTPAHAVKKFRRAYHLLKTVT